MAISNPEHWVSETFVRGTSGIPMEGSGPAEDRRSSDIAKGFDAEACNLALSRHGNFTIRSPERTTSQSKASVLLSYLKLFERLHLEYSIMESKPKRTADCECLSFARAALERGSYSLTKALSCFEQAKSDMSPEKWRELKTVLAKVVRVFASAAEDLNFSYRFADYTLVHREAYGRPMTNRTPVGTEEELAKLALCTEQLKPILSSYAGAHERFIGIVSALSLKKEKRKVTLRMRGKARTPRFRRVGDDLMAKVEQLRVRNRT